MQNYPIRKSVRKKQRKSGGFSRWLFYFMALIFFGVIIYCIFFSSFLQIAEIKIGGLGKISETDIRQRIDTRLGGKFLGFVEKNNLFLVSRKKIKKDILDISRRIRNVEVRKKIPSGLEVNIFERIPMLIVCNGKCFILDETGETYDDSENTLVLEEKENLIRLRDQSGRTIDLGSVFLDKNYIKYVLDIKNRLEGEIGLEIDNNFETPSFISDDIRVKTKGSWWIYFNENIELEKEIEVLRAVLEKEIAILQRADLEYVDLRIDNKVYYKFRDGTPSAEERQKELEAVSASEIVPSSNISNSENGDKKKNSI